jgi:Divergent InlB B-repeat domain
VQFRPSVVGVFASHVSFSLNGDTISVGVSGSATSAPSASVDVTKTGTGTGTVTSPAGISCGGDCSELLSVGDSLTLTATADDGSTFAGWSGGCAGTGPRTVTLTGNLAVTAKFDTVAPPVPPPAGNPTVTQVSTDATGVTFLVTWTARAGTTTYRYSAAFQDGSASRRGTVRGSLSLRLRMPYHRSGSAFDAFVCITPARRSQEQSCSRFTVPARPTSASVERTR